MVASAEGDVGDADLSELLPMSGLPAVILPPLEFEHVDLGLLAHADDLGFHLGPGDERGARVDGLAVGGEQDLVEGDLGPRLGVEERQADRFALLGPELLARGPENRVHGMPACWVWNDVSLQT